MDYLLGIDIGTSSCKAALFHPDGTVLAQQNGAYPLYHPQPGWAEQDPHEWWAAVCSVVRGVLEQSGVRPHEIAGIGVDGQSGSAVALDARGERLCNTPIWMDLRSAALCRRTLEQIPEQRIFALSGNPFMPAYSTPKLLWYREQLPDLYAKIRHILQSNSYIVYRLCGVLSQDRSQGYGYHFFDLRRGELDAAMAQEFGIDPALVPPLYDCHAVVGRVSARAAAQTGLCEGIPVVAGGLDAACGTLGAGVVRAGQTQEQGGQAGGMSICLEDYVAHPALINSCHVVPQRWLLQGGTVGGGGALRWFEEQFGFPERAAAAAAGTSAFYELDRLAERVPAGSEGVLFLPYLSGERSPIWDENAKGVYYGLDYHKTRAHMARATLEGVAFSLLHNLKTAEQVGARVDTLFAMGGAANSRLWTQIKADVTGKAIAVPSSDTATTLGAAILAGVGVGVYPGFEEAVERTVHIQRTHTPDPAHRAVYDRAFAQYLKLSERVRGL